MKQFIITILFLLTITALYAQLYIQPQVGYSFALNPDIIHSSISINNIKNEYSTKLLFAQGINLGLGIGYKINPHLCFIKCAFPFITL